MRKNIFHLIPIFAILSGYAKQHNIEHQIERGKNPRYQRLIGQKSVLNKTAPNFQSYKNSKRFNSLKSRSNRRKAQRRSK